jgi:FkbM family methyltransferase
LAALYLRSLAKRFLWKLGYDVRRASTASGVDPFLALKAIFANAEVRTIVDVGAYVGEYTARALSLFPHADAYCFEPTPASFAQLSARFRGNPRVHAYQMALADDEGTARFHLNANPVNNSLLQATSAGDIWSDQPGALAPVSAIEVPVSTLESSDTLKVGCQRAHLVVLKGAGGWTSGVAPGQDQSYPHKASTLSLYDGQAYAKDIWDYLDACRFGLFNFYNQVIVQDESLEVVRCPLPEQEPLGGDGQELGWGESHDGRH